MLTGVCAVDGHGVAAGDGFTASVIGRSSRVGSEVLGPFDRLMDSGLGEPGVRERRVPAYIRIEVGEPLASPARCGLPAAGERLQRIAVDQEPGQALPEAVQHVGAVPRAESLDDRVRKEAEVVVRAATVPDVQLLDRLGEHPVVQLADQPGDA
jgi:hypothetical protein